MEMGTEMGMDIGEVLVFILCGVLTLIFLLFRWYNFTLNGWPPERNKKAKYIFGLLPFVSLAVILYTLFKLASFDVVGDALYTAFYVAIGFAWIYMGLTAMSLFFDISWIDDALNLSNNAALAAVAGGFIGITLIYAGANIGDGPGWWCVIFAGGLGLVSWILLGIIINIVTKAFYNITVGRDFNCGIRTGSYFLASGIILARACAGDWTSFSMTVIEFSDGWPVLVLTALMIAVEIFLINHIDSFKPRYNSYSKSEIKAGANDSNLLSVSIIAGIIYIILAIVSVILLPPLPVNPSYSDLAVKWGAML